MSGDGGSQLIEIDPAELHLPPSRSDGADPAKLQRQISQYGRSIDGMPTIWVSHGTDGRYMINNGVTRATRAAKLLPGVTISAMVIGEISVPAGRYPKVGDKLP